MTRIVSGTAGGRRLVVPKGETTRPTSERVREALFSMLDTRGAVRGARVLDLYCGSGALGLEAASRGAAEVVLVDSAHQAVAAARQNVAALGLPRVSVVVAAAERHVAAAAGRPFDLVLLDPPYAVAADPLAAVLARLADGGWLAEDALVVVERSTRTPEPRWPDGLERVDVRRYGDTSVWIAAATVAG